MRTVPSRRHPRGFVRVIFVEYGWNVYFTAGQPDDGALILGNIRDHLTQFLTGQ